MNLISNIIREEISKILNESVNIKKMVFVSYGTDKFDKNAFKNVQLDSYRAMVINKPIGGLWASPLNSKFGWGEWCNAENFRVRTLNTHFLFRLSPNAQIYIIDSLEDLIRVSTLDTEYGEQVIDFKLLYNKGCDGIFVTKNGLREATKSYIYNIKDLSAWDVESICIFNPDVVIPIEENIIDKTNVPRYEKPIYDDGDDISDDFKFLQMNSDFDKYGNHNIQPNMSKLFNNKHLGLMAQKHGNSKDAKLARNFNGTVKK